MAPGSKNEVELKTEKEEAIVLNEPQLGAAMLAFKASDIAGTVANVDIPQILVNDLEPEKSSEDQEAANNNPDNDSICPTPLIKKKYLGVPPLFTNVKESLNTVKSAMSEQIAKLRQHRMYQKLTSICLAFASAFFMTLYSAIFAKIEKDIALFTVLLVRGGLQVLVSGFFCWCLGISFLPTSGAGGDDILEQQASIEASGHKAPLGESDTTPEDQRWHQRLKRSFGRPLSWIGTKIAKTSWQNKALFWLFFTAFVAGTRLSLLFSALKGSQMASVHSIMQGSPILVMVIGHFFLKDRLNAVRIVSAFLLIAGICLVATGTVEQQLEACQTGNGTECQNRPKLTKDQVFKFATTLRDEIIEHFGRKKWRVFSREDDHDESKAAFTKIGDNSTFDKIVNLAMDMTQKVSSMADPYMGIMYAILALILSAFGTCLTKRVSINFEKFAISFYIGVAITVAGLVGLTAIQPDIPMELMFPRNFDLWACAFSVGLLGVLQQLCLIAAIEKGSPTIVTLIRSIQIVLSFFIQITQLNQNVSLLAMLGAFVIIVSAAMVAFEDLLLVRAPACCKNAVDNELEEAEAGEAGFGNEMNDLQNHGEEAEEEEKQVKKIQGA